MIAGLEQRQPPSFCFIFRAFRIAGADPSAGSIFRLLFTSQFFQFFKASSSFCFFSRCARCRASPLVGLNSSEFGSLNCSPPVVAPALNAPGCIVLGESCRPRRSLSPLSRPA